MGQLHVCVSVFADIWRNRAHDGYHYVTGTSTLLQPIGIE